MLPKWKHTFMVTKAGLLEYKEGSPERGRSIFEGLLGNDPQRTDLWSVYIAAETKAHTPPVTAKAELAPVRALLERCCGMKLKATKMKFFFKQWHELEKKWGDAESQEKVVSKARLFVEGIGN